MSPSVVVSEFPTGDRRRIDLTSVERDQAGWNEVVTGWSLGPRGVIRVDEPWLQTANIGIVRASNHIFLWGHVPVDVVLPEFAIWKDLYRRWLRPTVSRNGEKLSCRFDHCALWIGRHVVEWYEEENEAPLVGEWPTTL